MTVLEFTIRKPDDWHLHVRDGDMLKSVIGYSSANFRRAIIMPNLLPPIVTMNQVIEYRNRILAAVPDRHSFEPMMTLYLTETTSRQDVETAAKDGIIRAIKLYPAGATTNSESGVRDFEKIVPILECMAGIGLPLLVHGEVTDPDVDVFDREAVFIERVLDPIRKRLPELRVVLEHVTTIDGVDYVSGGGPNISATITAHHLIINRNAILAGGIKPHFYCLPVAKREKHRRALRRAACSGDTKFFLGTDSAPHRDDAKESACGCAGIFSAINALSCLVHVFEEESALDKFEAFAALNGPAFYRLPPNVEMIRFFKTSEPVPFPEKIDVQDGKITVFDPGFALFWRHEPINALEI